MISAVMRPLPTLSAVLLFCLLPPAHAQALPVATDTVQNGPVATGIEIAAPVLAPFVASYEAHYHGKQAGNATMQVVREAGLRWRVDLGIEGRRGLAGVLGLNVQQSTVFESGAEGYRPISQSTIRKGLFMGRKSVGVYDWTNRSARWQGDIKQRHQQPVALQPGDMSGLLINLAIIRDAHPGATLRYRFVEGGRVRDHRYQVAATPETIAVAGLRYSALRVTRTNSGNDSLVVWVAEGVPTPVRILQKEDGEETVDLHLIEYH